MQEYFKVEEVECHYSDERFDLTAGQIHRIVRHYYDEMTGQFVVEIDVYRPDTGLNG